MTPLDVDLPYLSEEIDRHKNVRLYVRKGGRRIRLRFGPKDDGFVQAYNEALAILKAPAGTKAKRADRAKRGTLGWLAAQYFVSEGNRGFKTLDEQSRRTRRGIIEDCLREPRKPKSSDLFRDCPVSALTAKHVQILMERRADKKGAANNRLKYLSAMFGWAVAAKIMTSNPARDVDPIRYATSGFYTWTMDDVRQFEERHPIGTKARLALALLLFTGVRRGDLVTLGRQHIKDGWLRFIPRKTRHVRAVASEKPVLPILSDIIAKSPAGNMTLLVTEYGRPFTAAGFGAWFRKRCNEAGLPQCTAHGLRKAGATMLAERGATDRQLMAVYDWTSASQATIYTRAASRKKLAGEAMHLLAQDQSGTDSVSHRSDNVAPAAK